MFDSIRKVSEREKGHIKRESYFPTHLPIKSPTDNGVRFSNNTIFTQGEGNISTRNQSEMLLGIVQRRLYPIVGETDVG